MKMRAAIFALSVVRIRDLNVSYFNELKKPFISYAIRDDNVVMAVDLGRKIQPFACPLFEHLENVR
jgi:hypothetical protein